MPTSSRDASGQTRRSILTGLAGMVALPAAAEELQSLRGRPVQFVYFEPMPAMLPLILFDLRNRPIPLEPPRNGLLLLNVWATWCPACREELPRLASQVDALARLKVRVAAVSIDTKAPAEVEAYVRKVQASVLRIYRDPSGKVISARRADGTDSPFQNWRMPPTFVIDAEARVRGYMPGSVDWMAPERSALLNTILASQ